MPAVVVKPDRSDQVTALLGYAAERGIPVTPRAAGTNLCGGFAPTPESVALDLSGLNRVVEVDVEARRAVVEPGVINAALQEHLRPSGLCWSPDPASAAISTVGGNIAENAGGPSCIKHGVTFHHVLGLEVALAGGRLLRLDRDDEVDLLGLMIGSEGILGVVTQAVLSLRPLPRATWTALAAFDRIEEAALTVSAIVAEGLTPSALELCDQRQVQLCEAWKPSGYPVEADAILFAEVDGDPEAVAAAAPALESVLRRFDPGIRRCCGPARWRPPSASTWRPSPMRATATSIRCCSIGRPRPRPCSEPRARSRRPRSTSAGP